MLPEEEIRERVRYCYCVFRQLNWLYGNSSIPASNYLQYLDRSSLALLSDEFLATTLVEAAQQEILEEEVRALITLYEGFVHALCEVLETDMETIQQEIDSAFLLKLASEMDVVIE